MSVTTSQRLNADQVVAALPAGTYFSAIGSELPSTNPKTLTGIGATDAQLQTAITAAAAAFIDRAVNAGTLQQRAQTALSNNQTYLGIAAPTQAQAVAQVGALTRQVDGLIRFLLGAFDTIADS